MLKMHPVRKSRQFSCDLCVATFTVKEAIAQHMSIHKGKKFLCNVCNKLFANDYKLTEHTMIHVFKKKATLAR